MITIKNSNKVTARSLERFVQISGFRVAIVITCEVNSTAIVRKVPKFLTTPVIQQIDPQLVGRPIESQRSQH